MSWLYEQQLTIVVLGVAVILGLGAAWSASGRKELLYAIAAAIVLLIAGLLIERLVVTDKEAIRATVLEIARDLQNNNRRAVLAHISSTTPTLQRKAEAELPNYQFTECRVTKIHRIDVDDHTEPRSAIAEFNIIASGTFRPTALGGSEITDTIPRWIQLHLLREKDGRWTVAEYDHDSPERMMFDRPSEGRATR
jgi:low affinity Fe/Cu permease